MNQTFEEVMDKVNKEDHVVYYSALEDLIDELEKSDIEPSDTLSVSTIINAINQFQEQRLVVEDVYSSVTKEQLDVLKQKVAHFSRLSVDEIKEKAKLTKEDIVLPSGELISKEEVLEAVRAFSEEMNHFYYMATTRAEMFWEELEEYLKTRNLSEEQREEIHAKYSEVGYLTEELADEIKQTILTSLEEQNLNESAKDMASEMLEIELKEKKEEEEKNFDELLKKAPHPLRSFHQHHTECPIIPLDRYKDTKEDLFKFAKDFGIDKKLIDDLIDQSNKEEAMGKIWQQLEDNHCILTDDQKQKDDIYQTLKNDLNHKIKKVVILTPTEALPEIYKKMGFDEKEISKLIENAHKTGTPGKEFYKKARKSLFQQQEELRKKTEASIKNGQGSVRRNKELKEDYLAMIRERQKTFENIYTLNRRIKKDDLQANLDPNTFEIIKEEKINIDKKTKNSIKKSTVASQEYQKHKLLKTLLHRHVNKNLAVGDVVMVEGMEYPITALSVVSKEKELMTVTPGETIEDLMKKLGIKSVTKGEFSFAVPIDGKNHFYDYNTPLEILPKQEEQRKVK